MAWSVLIIQHSCAAVTTMPRRDDNLRRNSHQGLTTMWTKKTQEFFHAVPHKHHNEGRAITREKKYSYCHRWPNLRISEFADQRRQPNNQSRNDQGHQYPKRRPLLESLEFRESPQQFASRHHSGLLIGTRVRSSLILKPPSVCAWAGPRRNRPATR